MSATKAPKEKKTSRQPKAKKQAKPKKASALDAAARVLTETSKPMTCPEMITAMATKGYWTSPGGKTPAATLYSGIIIDIRKKGKESRFTKTGPGKFGLNKKM
jgi:hypothetical protein